MAVTGLDHVQLAIPQGGEELAREFYAQRLGMAEVQKPSNLSKTGCWFTSGGVNLHVGVDANFAPARKAHPAFIVDNLEELRVNLSGSGFEIFEDQPIAGFDRFFTADPFGNRIELMQRL